MSGTTDITWRGLSGLRRLLGALSPRGVVRLGAGLGLLLRAFGGRRVMAAEERCARALGVGAGEARRIVRESYANLGRSAAEFLSANGGGKVSSVMTLHGEEHLRRAFEKNRGVILFSGHIGNWEHGAALLSELGYPMNAIGAEQRDDRVTSLIEELRAARGVTTVGKGLGLRAAMRCLKRGELLAILIDQDVRDRGVFVPFLGMPASTPFGMLRMAARLGSVVLPSFSLRRGRSAERPVSCRPREGGRWGRMEEAIPVRRSGERVHKGSTEQWMWLYPGGYSAEEFNNVRDRPRKEQVRLGAGGCGRGAVRVGHFRTNAPEFFRAVAGAFNHWKFIVENRAMAGIMARTAGSFGGRHGEGAAFSTCAISDF